MELGRGELSRLGKFSLSKHLYHFLPEYLTEKQTRQAGPETSPAHSTVTGTGGPTRFGCWPATHTVLKRRPDIVHLKR